MKFFTAFVPAFSLLVTATAVPSLRASSVSVYSSGFVVPETISLAPSSYGLPAGTLLVADAGNQASPGSTSTVYTVPPAGGTPTPIGGSFSAGAGGTYGGIFASCPHPLDRSAVRTWHSGGAARPTPVSIHSVRPVDR